MYISLTVVAVISVKPQGIVRRTSANLLDDQIFNFCCKEKVTVF